MGSAGSKAREVKEQAEANADKAKQAASESLQILMKDAEARLGNFKMTVLDQKLAESQGYIPVDQIIDEMYEVYVMTSTDSNNIKEGVHTLINDLFSGNIAKSLEDGFDLAVTALVGASKGEMSIKTTYALAMEVFADSPSISVVNTYLFNYRFKYEGIVKSAESVMGYTAINGSVMPRALHQGTLQTLLVKAGNKGILTEENFNKVAQTARAIYVEGETVVPSLMSSEDDSNKRKRT